MKITFSSINFIRNPIDKNRIIPEKGDVQSAGIKAYGKLEGWLRSHFGSAIELRDSRRHVWYVKREDFRSWMAEGQGALTGFDSKQLEQILGGFKKPVDVKVEPKAENMTEIEALKLLVSKLEKTPNKTKAEKQQLKESHNRLDKIGAEKAIELANYIKNLKIESEEEIGQAVKEWMQKYQAIAKIGNLELSEETELQIVNNTIAGVSKVKNPLEVLQATLLLLSLELTKKLEKKINPR